MKLNLLPNTVSKQRQASTAYVVAALILFGFIVAAVITSSYANSKLAAAKPDDQLKTDAANAAATSKQADEILTMASPIVRNAALAQAIIDHNAVYPKLYDDVKPYIPPFFRVTSMHATPIDTTSCQLELVGTIDTYQRYADLMFALSRFKDVVSISRNNYNLDDPIVPPLTEEDQHGNAHKPSQGTVPDDPLQRLAYFQAQAQTDVSGYTGVGNFGSDNTDARQAMPGSSLITVVMVISRDIRVPDIAATLKTGGTDTGAATASLGRPGPGAAGGPFGGPGGDTASAPVPPARGGKGKKGGDDE